MEDIFDSVISEMEESIEGDDGNRFVIDTDQMAERAMRSIRKLMQEAERRTDICDAEIKRYTEAKAEILSEYDRKVSGLKFMLNRYFETVETKKTKTKESYTLISGTLVRKQKLPKAQIDDDVFGAWLADNYPEYIKTEVVTKPMWGEFKKTLTISGAEYVTADGLIVDGVYAIQQEPEFTVEFKKEG